MQGFQEKSVASFQEGNGKLTESKLYENFRVK